MIDLGRMKDMEALTARVNNRSLPLADRRKAYHAVQNIKRSMGNPVITKFRLRLIAACMVNDLENILKISLQLEDYEQRQRMHRI